MDAWDKQFYIFTVILLFVVGGGIGYAFGVKEGIKEGKERTQDDWRRSYSFDSVIIEQKDDLIDLLLQKLEDAYATR